MLDWKLDWTVFLESHPILNILIEKLYNRQGSQDTPRGSVRVTGAHCRSHLLWKGNAVEGSDPLFLPVQIPATENQEDWGRGVTEQNLIWPAHWSIGIAAGREQVHGLLTLTTGADTERQRAFSDTYQTECFLSSCLDRAPHPVSGAISVIAVLSPISAGDTIYPM